MTGDTYHICISQKTLLLIRKMVEKFMEVLSLDLLNQKKKKKNKKTLGFQEAKSRKNKLNNLKVKIRNVSHYKNQVI